MSGTVKRLRFAEGVEVSAPTDLGIATSTVVIGPYATTAAYVSANGAAANGSVFIDTTLNKFTYYSNSSWRTALPAEDSSDPTKTVAIDLSTATTAKTATVQFPITNNRTFIFPDASTTLLGTNAIQTITNKIYDGGTASTTNRLYIPKDTKSNLNSLTKTESFLVYATDEKTLYIGDGSTWQSVGGGGGGGGGAWNPPDGTGAMSEITAEGEKAFLFPDADDCNLVLFVKVPSNYVAGGQINLDIICYSTASSNKFRMKTVTTLLALNSSAIDSTTNTYSSTNAGLTNTVAKQIRGVTLDLTSSTGTINSVAVAAGDMLKIVLTRDYADADDTDTTDVRFLPSSTSLRFR